MALELKEGAFADHGIFTLPMGCLITEIEGGRKACMTDFREFVASDNFGIIINPLLPQRHIWCDFEIRIGQTISDDVGIDADGQHPSGSFMDYTMPRSDDSLNFFIEHHSGQSAIEPLGIKACCAAEVFSLLPEKTNAITHVNVKNDLLMQATRTNPRVSALLSCANTAAE